MRALFMRASEAVNGGALFQPLSPSDAIHVDQLIYAFNGISCFMNLFMPLVDDYTLETVFRQSALAPDLELGNSVAAATTCVTSLPNRSVPLDRGATLGGTPGSERALVR